MQQIEKYAIDHDFCDNQMFNCTALLQNCIVQSLQIGTWSPLKVNLGEKSRHQEGRQEMFAKIVN